MSLGRTLTRFVFLAAIGHQVTYTLVEGGIFADARTRLARLHPKVEEFVNCHLCVGTWVGAMLAALYRPNLLADVEGRRPSGLRNLANLTADAFLIALGTRVWNELLGWLRREVQVKQGAVDALEASDGRGVERASMPGISIRS